MKTSNRIGHLSVIIPTLNEGERIESAIRAVRTDLAVGEVIVADGGSTDGTRERAARAGARVILHDRPIHEGGGRGGQIRAGLEAAAGDLVAIVHADTSASAPAFSRIRRVMRRNPDVIGGAYGCRFESADVRFRLLEWANAVRVLLTGIAFGDQVQFFRRVPVVESGVFPAIPLMEDVELSLRLKRLGRTVFLFGDARVSTRRWERKRFLHTGTVIRLFTAYLFQRMRGTPDVVAMYRRYYG